MTDRGQSKFERLMRAVREASSQSEDYQGMLDEWTVVAHRYDESCGGVCTCGKTKLAHLFTIRNAVTGRVLDPIGSLCISHFEDERLDAEVHALTLRWEQAQRLARTRRAAEERAQREAEQRAERERQTAQQRREAEGRRVLATGKYAGRTFQWIVENTRGYIDFVAENGHKPELRALVRYARSG